MARVIYRVSRYLLAFALLGITSKAAYGQAWTRAAGETYVKFFYGEVTASKQYTFDGRTVDFMSGLPGDTYRDRSLYIYSEVGLSGQFTLFLSFPYKRTFVRDHAFRFRLYGPGAVMIGGRYSLNELLGIDQGRQTLALNMQAFIPAGYVRNYTPSSGGGQVDFQGTLFYGMSLYPFPAYVQVGAGYRHRSSMYLFSKAVECTPGSDIHCVFDTRPDYQDEWLFHVEAGVAPMGGLLQLQALGIGVLSVNKPAVGFSPLNPVPTSQRYLKVGAGIAMYPFQFLNAIALSSLGFNVQYFKTPIGRNTVGSRDLFLGFEYRFALSRK